MIHILGKRNSILNQYISELRDVEVQNDRMRFRHNMERIGTIIGYEISKKLAYTSQTVQTPLGTATMSVLAEQLVLSAILRAGLPLHQGLLHVFDKAENAFVAAYRKYHKDSSFDVTLDAVSSPDLEGKTLVIADPMLATGSSIVMAYHALVERGQPKQVHIATVIASNEGLEHVEKNLPIDQLTIWTGAVDFELTAKGYIVPGLGDAGDLSFGVKT